MGPGGAPFSVSHFIWNELQIIAEDACKVLPFAPYVMFIIERVTGYTFTKDGLHNAYRGEKPHHAAIGETLPQFSAAVDRPESSHSSSCWKKKSKLSRFLRK